MAYSIREGVRVYEGNKTIKCEPTHWFPHWIKPEHKGDYVLGSDRFHFMNHWDGKMWRRYDGSPAPDQELMWCGWTGRYL